MKVSRRQTLICTHTRTHGQTHTMHKITMSFIDQSKTKPEKTFSVSLFDFLLIFSDYFIKYLEKLWRKMSKSNKQQQQQKRHRTEEKWPVFKLKREYERKMVCVCERHIHTLGIQIDIWNMEHFWMFWSVTKWHFIIQSLSLSVCARACERACQCIKKHVKRVLRLSKHIKQHCMNDKIITSPLLCCDGRYTIESGLYFIYMSVYVGIAWILRQTQHHSY